MTGKEVRLDRREFLRTAAGTCLAFGVGVQGSAAEQRDESKSSQVNCSSICDLRSLPRGTSIVGDVCIIGAGAAGITVAVELANSRLRVVLVESGGFDFEDGAQELYAGQVVGQHMHDLHTSRLRIFGGTTNHWSGICRPFDPIDFESRAWIAESGWPIKFDSLQRFYKIAHQYCELGVFDYRPESMIQSTDPGSLLPDGRVGDAIMRFSPPTRFGEVYREKILASLHMQTYLHANLVGWNTSENGNTVQSINVSTIEGHVFDVSARWFVLATGGIENARLLLQPAPGHPNGVGNNADLVGRYFADHAFISKPAIVFLERALPQVELFKRRTVNGVDVQRVLIPTSATQMAEHLLNCHLWLAPGETGISPALTSFKHLKNRMRQLHWPEDFGYHIGQVVTELDAILLSGRIPTGYEHVLVTEFECEVPPDRTSRVTLLDEVDSLGMRRVKVDWRVSPDVYRTLNRVHEILGEELQRRRLGKVQFVVNEAYVDHTNYGDFHHMGTTRMHDDPNKGVVDRNCRVHGVDNLFVAGSSVFPTYGHANPTLTIVTLAARLADHLRNRV